MQTSDIKPKNKVLGEAIKILPELISWRRKFHMQPELGFQEVHTAEVIANLMENFGFQVKRGVGKTGVIADMGTDRPRFAIRADMDALPILENSNYKYVSQTPGVMHACGHDAHMACALGAAYMLAKERLPGSIRFIFQPSEEIADEEGLSGAQRMIQDQALDGVDLIIAMHVEGTTPSGSIRIEDGPASGGVDSWFGEIIGRGGHGAHPHETIDPFYFNRPSDKCFKFHCLQKNLSVQPSSHKHWINQWWIYSKCYSGQGQDDRDVTIHREKSAKANSFGDQARF